MSVLEQQAAELQQHEERLTSLEKKPTNKEKKKFGLKQNIATGIFVGFIMSFIWFLWFFDTTDLHYFRIIISIWIGFWSIILLFGFSKGSIIEFGSSLAKILMNNTYTPEEKFALLMNVIQQWLGLAADLSQFINAEKKLTT